MEQPVFIVGAWRSLVAYLHGVQVVVGSNPAAPTITKSDGEGGYVMLGNYLIFLIFSLVIAADVLAICPLCTFAVGAGIGLTQYLGIDDVITGLWIGGFIVSLVFL